MTYRTFFLGLLILLSSCMSYDFSRRVVQQGNLITEEKMQQIKPGISKERAAIIMGTSLMSPLFNEDRWDYAYTWRKGSGPLLKKHLSLHFKDGTLVHVEHGSGSEGPIKMQPSVV